MASAGHDDDDLAYGDDPGQASGAVSGPGLVTEVHEALGRLRRFSGRLAQDLSTDIDEPYVAPESSTRAAMPPRQQSWRMSLASLQQSLNSFGSEVKNQWSGGHGVYEKVLPSEGTQKAGESKPTGHRFGSFASERKNNQAKWYIDGCSYMWAVSIALEQAKEEIWIMDWWLNPELYLRRPPSQHEQYRLDRVLKAAAERGVKVNVLLYQEVPQALSLDSAHTQQTLEALHPNISVFRHPDHLHAEQSPDDGAAKDVRGSKDVSIAKLANLSDNSVKALFGTHDETVLYWAHNEKLVVVDGHVAFLGGLDLCHGQWDTHQHSITDVHPGDVNRTVFPGQDFRNAPMYDFQDPSRPNNDELDRTKNARMGWTDISVGISGPVVEDLKLHFTQRWNLIYDAKFQMGEEQRYQRLPDILVDGAPLLDQARSYGLRLMNTFSQTVRSLRQGDYTALDPSTSGSKPQTPKRDDGYAAVGARPAANDDEDDVNAYDYDNDDDEDKEDTFSGAIDCQILRSCSQWSHGVGVERSVQSAYVEAIRDSKHFIYIENQFFITATGNSQDSVQNQIGTAIVERIARAARNNEPFKIVVCIPAMHGFTGDLKSDEALPTLTIMDHQYKSINRGGYSIYEKLSEQGVEGTDYIRFYNLRSYDRINASAALRSAEEKSGVSYENARKAHDDKLGAGLAGSGDNVGAGEKTTGQLKEYQSAAKEVAAAGSSSAHQWDNVTECYMLGGEDLQDVPWEQGGVDEIDAFVSKELYIHSKVMIVDDQIVICGSANLNDRSQLGSHDSEIAVYIDDKDIVESLMAGQKWQASRFAGTLRRQLFRKHLGLLGPQELGVADDNSLPVGTDNLYDWNSPEDQLVSDPLSDRFWGLWNERAQTNTAAFAKVFHPVPTNEVKNWREYDAYFERFSKEETGKPESLWKEGHVVAENFAEGEAGLREVKEILSTIKGNLVQMPLLFLQDEQIGQQGLTLDASIGQLYI